MSVEEAFNLWGETDSESDFLDLDDEGSDGEPPGTSAAGTEQHEAGGTEGSSDDSDGNDEQDTPNPHPSYYIGKNKVDKWLKNPPVEGRTAARNILFPPPGVTCYATQRLTDCLFSSFLLFFTMEMLDLTLRFTNKYGAECLGDSWQPITELELRAYIGLRILAGVCRSSGETLDELWSTERGRPQFRATMSLARFNKITRFLRFDDRLQRRSSGVTSKLGPVTEIWQLFLSTLSKSFVPFESVTVDEQLVSFRGRCPFRQYMPSKPAKYGIKFWLCCDSKTSYVLNGDIYTGREEGAPVAHNLGRNVVMKLVVPNLEGSGRNITMDNFFTSVSLARELIPKNLTLVGTMRKNNSEIPREFLPNKTRRVESSLFGFQGGMTLVSYVPKKGKAVILLSSMHRDSTTSGSRSKPEIIEYYNKTKGGVDTCDQRVSTYTSKRMGRRWSMVVFSNIVDIACLNAYIIWSLAFPTWKSGNLSRRRLFLLELSREMITPCIEARNIANLPGTSRRLASTVVGVVPDNRKRGRCHICTREGDRKSQQRCATCKLFVCPPHSVVNCRMCANAPGS
uniref:PiggyBac transposable element-derived protein domain-containing protein n=1 Tax=Sphenodon punctatus TaxID=8508 RepID=A0A8D0GYX9_SPHPU